MEQTFTTPMTSPKDTQPGRPIDLSIVIPAYQEAAIISDSLGSLAKWLDKHDYGVVEVVVVVADSPDGTADLARVQSSKFEHFLLVEPGHRVGKGRDVRSGILHASGRYRLFMDADLATPLVHLDDVAKLMSVHADVGIAVRNLARIHPGIKRRVVSEIGNLLAQIVLLPGIHDTQCGFKVFRADVAEAVFRRLTILGWGFDLEVLAITRKLGYKITTFNVPDWTDPKAATAGLASDSVVDAAMQTFGDLIRIRLNLWSGAYRSPEK
jgi:dolichyl-phosphate beta-glucosyltransferase